MDEYRQINPDEVIQLVHRTKEIILDPARVKDISVKGAADYVTAADKGVQDFLEKELARLTPQAGLFAEEKINEKPDPTRAYWVLDPVDGTTNLIHDARFSAVSLALVEDGDPVMGIVYNPFTEETFTAVRGEGARLNGRPITRPACSRLADAVVSFGSSPYRKDFAKEMFPVCQRIFEQSSDFRRGGSAALELCYTAIGRLDAYFERDLKPWDYSAGWLIAQEAGARCSTFTGQPFPAFENADILACAPGIYDVLLAQLPTFSQPLSHSGFPRNQ